MLEVLVGLIILLILVAWIVKHRKSFVIVLGIAATLATITGLASLYMKDQEERQATLARAVQADSLSALQAIFDSLGFHPGYYSGREWRLRRWEMIDSTGGHLLYAVRYSGESVGIRVVFHDWRFTQTGNQWSSQRRYKSIGYFAEVICASEQIQITDKAFYADERPTEWLWRGDPSRMYDVQAGWRRGPFVPPDDSEFRKALDYRCRR